MFDEHSTRELSCAEFSDLTRAADNRVLMTVGATDGVVHRSKAIFNRLPVCEQFAIGFKHRLADQAVRQIVESSRRRCSHRPTVSTIKSCIAPSKRTNAIPSLIKTFINVLHQKGRWSFRGTANVHTIPRLFE